MAAIPQRQKKAEASGGWIITFADLMSLLLTFFILLLSFSSMDVRKYEMMAQSMAASFGFSFTDTSAGGQIIFEEAAAPPTPPSEDTSALEMEFAQMEQEFEEQEEEEIEILEQTPSVETVTQIDPNIENLTETLVDELEEEIISNALNVTYDKNRVVVRFSEATTFTSGSEELMDEMLPIIEKIENVLAECTGDIVVSGYTDDLPVTGSRFRSNWDLSAARAVSVVHQLVFNNKIDADRVIAAGRAETNALAPNDSAENRAKNRRVEISIDDPKCETYGFDF